MLICIPNMCIAAVQRWKGTLNSYSMISPKNSCHLVMFYTLWFSLHLHFYELQYRDFFHHVMYFHRYSHGLRKILWDKKYDMDDYGCKGVLSNVNSDILYTVQVNSHTKTFFSICLTFYNIIKLEQKMSICSYCSSSTQALLTIF